MRRVVQAGLGVGVLAVLAASLSLYQVDAREYALVTRFGRPVTTRTEPGLYLKWPSPIEHVYRIESRLQVYLTRLVECLTRDAKNIIVQCYVVWKVKDPSRFLVTVSTPEVARERLDSALTAELGATVGDYDMAAIASVREGEQKLAEMESLMRERVNAKTTAKYGIEVADVGICRLALSEDNVQSVYDRMRAERDVKAKSYRSQGRAEAAKITIEANLQRDKILSEAEGKARASRGEADAQATRIYGQALSQDPELYEFLRTLEVYEKILKENTTAVLSSDSWLFRLLNERPPASGPTPRSAATQAGGGASVEKAAEP